MSGRRKSIKKDPPRGLFGINPSTYALWQGTTVDATPAVLTQEVFQRGFERITRELSRPKVWQPPIVNPREWDEVRRIMRKRTNKRTFDERLFVASIWARGHWR